MNRDNGAGKAILGHDGHPLRVSLGKPGVGCNHRQGGAGCHEWAETARPPAQETDGVREPVPRRVQGPGKDFPGVGIQDVSVAVDNGKSLIYRGRRSKERA